MLETGLGAALGTGPGAAPEIGLREKQEAGPGPELEKRSAAA